MTTHVQAAQLRTPNFGKSTRSRVRRALAIVGIAAASAAVVSACSSTPKAAARPPAIVMVSPTQGYATWPSGARWIVLSTNDGWVHVSNRTPLAVPTDGGLALAAEGNEVRVGVLPFHQLQTSPVMFSSNGGRTWTATQLGVPLSSQADALKVVAGATFATSAKGAVYRLVAGSGSWVSLGIPTDTSGNPVPPSLRNTMLCASGNTLLQYSAKGDVVTVQRTTAGATTSATAPGTGTPVLGCGAGQLWMLRVTSSGSQIYTLTGANAWQNPGHVTVQATAMGVADVHTLFVSTSDTTGIVRINMSPTPHASTIALPKWVATVGGSSMKD